MKKTTTNFIKKQTDVINIPANNQKRKLANNKKTKQQTNTNENHQPITIKPYKNNKTNIQPANKDEELILRWLKIDGKTKKKSWKTQPTDGYVPVLLQKTEENKLKAIAPRTIKMKVDKIEQKETNGYSWITNSKQYQSEDHWINYDADFKNYKNKQLSWQQDNTKIYKKRKKIIEEKFIIPMSKIEENIIEKITKIIDENNLNSYTAKELQKIILDISRQTQKLKQKIETLENNIFFQNKILTKPTDDIMQAYDKTKKFVSQNVIPYIKSLREELKAKQNNERYYY